MIFPLLQFLVLDDVKVHKNIDGKLEEDCDMVMFRIFDNMFTLLQVFSG